MIVYIFILSFIFSSENKGLIVANPNNYNIHNLIDEYRACDKKNSNDAFLFLIIAIDLYEETILSSDVKKKLEEEIKKIISRDDLDPFIHSFAIGAYARIFKDEAVDFFFYLGLSKNEIKVQDGINGLFILGSEKAQNALNSLPKTVKNNFQKYGVSTSIITNIFDIDTVSVINMDEVISGETRVIENTSKSDDIRVKSLINLLEIQAKLNLFPYESRVFTIFDKIFYDENESSYLKNYIVLVYSYLHHDRAINLFSNVLTKEIESKKDLHYAMLSVYGLSSIKNNKSSKVLTEFLNSKNGKAKISYYDNDILISNESNPLNKFVIDVLINRSSNELPSLWKALIFPINFIENFYLQSDNSTMVSLEGLSEYAKSNPEILSLVNYIHYKNNHNRMLATSTLAISAILHFVFYKFMYEKEAASVNYYKSAKSIKYKNHYNLNNRNKFEYRFIENELKSIERLNRIIRNQEFKNEFLKLPNGPYICQGEVLVYKQASEALKLLTKSNTNNLTNEILEIFNSNKPTSPKSGGSYSSSTNSTQVLTPVKTLPSVVPKSLNPRTSVFSRTNNQVNSSLETKKLSTINIKTNPKANTFLNTTNTKFLANNPSPLSIGLNTSIVNQIENDKKLNTSKVVIYWGHKKYYTVNGIDWYLEGDLLKEKYYVSKNGMVKKVRGQNKFVHYLKYASNNLYLLQNHDDLFSDLHDYYLLVFEGDKAFLIRENFKHMSNKLNITLFTIERNGVYVSLDGLYWYKVVLNDYFEIKSTKDTKDVYFFNQKKNKFEIIKPDNMDFYNFSYEIIYNNLKLKIVSFPDHKGIVKLSNSKHFLSAIQEFVFVNFNKDLTLLDQNNKPLQVNSDGEIEIPELNIVEDNETQIIPFDFENLSLEEILELLFTSGYYEILKLEEEILKLLYDNAKNFFNDNFLSDELLIILFKGSRSKISNIDKLFLYLIFKCEEKSIFSVDKRKQYIEKLSNHFYPSTKILSSQINLNIISYVNFIKFLSSDENVIFKNTYFTFEDHSPFLVDFQIRIFNFLRFRKKFIKYFRQIIKLLNDMNINKVELNNDYFISLYFAIYVYKRFNEFEKQLLLENLILSYIQFQKTNNLNKVDNNLQVNSILNKLNQIMKNIEVLLKEMNNK